MAKVYEFLANGFEEVEGLTPIDVLRRGGVEVVTVSVSNDYTVSGAHGVEFIADALFEETDLSDADVLLLPGGMPGTLNLDNHKGVREALLNHAGEGKRIGAICAAPMVLGRLGLLRGLKATCYPGFEKYLDGADYTNELVTVDGMFITGKGPGASMPYSLTLLSLLCGDDKAREVAEGMIYKF